MPHTQTNGIMPPKPAGWGGKLLNTNSLRSSIFVILFLIVPCSLLCLACSEDAFYYPEMVAYHQESQHLAVVSADSVSRFSSKVEAFVALHPDAKQDPLYRDIMHNVHTGTDPFVFIDKDDPHSLENLRSVIDGVLNDNTNNN